MTHYCTTALLSLGCNSSVLVYGRKILLEGQRSGLTQSLNPGGPVDVQLFILLFVFFLITSKAKRTFTNRKDEMTQEIHRKFLFILNPVLCYFRSLFCFISFVVFISEFCFFF